MPHVDLSFPLVGVKPIPADHGYELFASLSRILPAVHSSNGIAIHPIRGRLVGDRLMSLTPRSRLVIRAPHELIPGLLPLAGSTLRLGATRLQLGVPEVRALVPAASLRSRLVVIKMKDAPTAAHVTPELFQQAARRQLEELRISDEAKLTLGKRRTLRIKSKEIVGYEVLVERLSAEESLALQEHGLGGRRHMGCGIFVPVRDKGTKS